MLFERRVSQERLDQDSGPVTAAAARESELLLDGVCAAAEFMLVPCSQM